MVQMAQSYWVSGCGTQAPQSKGGKVQYLEIKGSTIPNAGDGFFAMVDIPAKVGPGAYTGVTHTGAELDAIIQSEKSTSATNYSRTAAYAFVVEQDCYIDAATETLNKLHGLSMKQPLFLSGTQCPEQ